jgi:hypothetical protein
VLRIRRHKPRSLTFEPFRFRRAPAAGNVHTVLRKLMWTAIYGVIGALATIAARVVASRVWRVLTGEEPPAKK